MIALRGPSLLRNSTFPASVHDYVKGKIEPRYCFPEIRLPLEFPAPRSNRTAMLSLRRTDKKKAFLRPKRIAGQDHPLYYAVRATEGVRGPLEVPGLHLIPFTK